MNMALTNRPGFIPLIPRSIALFILFYQIRLFAADLADTSIFISALIGAFLTAIFLDKKHFNGKAIRPVQALIIIALIPWVIRFFIALPRLFFPGVSAAGIFLDSLLLNLDRNNFVSLLPFYWVAASTYFSIKSRIFLRADIIAANVFFLGLFIIMPSAALEAYRWPVFMIGLFALVFFLQILSLLLSMPAELKLRKKERIIAASFLFLFVFLGGALFLRPFQERAVERGGGLLEPRLFRFDFSQVLRLESEISKSDELVMIVRKDPQNVSHLLRRFTVSGYSSGKGFFRLEGIDEAAHPQHLPNRRTQLPVDEISAFRVVEQEFFIVNFDSNAFIGMNNPVEIIPFENWDASSFNSAYKVISHSSIAMPFELFSAVSGEIGPETLMLSPEKYAIFTYYGNNQVIAAFAREIIENSIWGYPLSYWEKIQVIYETLKFGEFRYSLRPGIAPDGNQLNHFLFTSKRGYCTYFAFAFCLMLRSLGIPSRIAVGFFVDPQTEVFNYFPVRADMAHAWVEVWFPNYGWIEYDPTTQILAEGEEFLFSQGTPQELFERLMQEIMENRGRLTVREGVDEEGVRADLAAMGRAAGRFFTQWGHILAALIIFILFLSLRLFFFLLSRLHKNPRKKALYLWAHTKRLLGFAGLFPSAAEAEWAKLQDKFFKGIYSLYLDTAKARFAPVYSAEDERKMAEHYRLFCISYRKTQPLRRRLLAWFLPPLALLLRPRTRALAGGKALGFILIFVFLFSLWPNAQAQIIDPTEVNEELADRIFLDALAAQRAENWERAIGLLNDGARAFPDDLRFPTTLGNIYLNRRLFYLAWDEFRRAEGLAPASQDLLLNLAGTAAFLNRNVEAASYLERFLVLDNNNRYVIGNLAWIYFKLHRLNEGEKLLLDAIERLGSDMDFSMTLGTIYSDMFRYEDAKNAYLDAIRKAEAVGDRLFAALSFYNLSILESRFFQFGLAYESANASLQAMNRASGRLARGELFLRRLELSRALDEYQAAFIMDSSPLSKLNLARVFLSGGRLHEAVLYARSCLRVRDHFWMINYGIDPVRYKRDIHEILMNAYRGLFIAESISVLSLWSAASFGDALQSISRQVFHRFRFSVHRHLFRKYSLLSANAYTGGGLYLKALRRYFDAFQAYPRRARVYLEAARRFEEALIPKSAPSYRFLEGRLNRNRNAFLEALAEFDPVWQRDMIALTYAELAVIGRRNDRQEAAQRLFALNRGALVQGGIRLPVEFQIAESLTHMESFLKRAARASGLKSSRLESPRFVLRFDSAGEGFFSSELFDRHRGIVVFRKIFFVFPGEYRLPFGPRRAAFVQALRDGVFDPF